MSNKWSETAMKDLTFAVLMSSNNGNVNIKANWEKVEQYMKSWGHDFSKGAMSQQWAKKIIKEFRQRHPDGNGDNNSAPATPANKSGGSSAARTPKTPASGKGKGKKRAADEDDEGDSPVGGFIANPIAKTKTSRNSAKKVKHEAETEAVAKAEADDEDEGIGMQPLKSEERDEDYNFALDV